MLGGRGEADQVAEKDRDDLPLLKHESGCGFTERRGALIAELRALDVHLAAARTDHHTPSLGRLCEDTKARPRLQPIGARPLPTRATRTDGLEPSTLLTIRYSGLSALRLVDALSGEVAGRRSRGEYAFELW